jgi:excisionase family DNA binding protein
VSEPALTPPDEEWLTVKEVAAEMRLTPATVRSWISTGTLEARRAGQRKWLIRRTALSEMLGDFDLQRSRREEGDPQPLRPRRRETVSGPGSPTWSSEDSTAVDPEDFLAVAEHEWRSALATSHDAPPDNWFGGRLEMVAQAAVRKANALRAADSSEEIGLSPAEAQLDLPHELSRAARRPGPEELWAEFDVRVLALRTVTTTWELASALEALAVTVLDITVELPRYRGRYGEWVERPWDEIVAEQARDQSTGPERA